MLIEQYGKIFGKILSSIDEGVHAVDADGNAIVYNRAMSEMEKMDVKDVLTRPFRDVFSAIPEQESTLLQALDHGTTTTGKYQTYTNCHGEEVTTVNTTMPVWFEKDIIGAIEIARRVADSSGDVFYDYEKMSMGEYLCQLEKGIIKTALKIWEGNVSRTADFLKVKRQTLQYKMRKYCLLEFSALARKH